MGEWDRMMAGLPYDDGSQEMFNLRVKAKRLTRAYNATTDDQVPERLRILSELFGSMGEDVWIEPDFRCEFGANIHMGNRVYVNFGCIILDCAPVTIGDDCLLGPNIGIYVADHGLDPAERAAGMCISRPVTIGPRVWLGGDVKIRGGVEIGENSVVGMGSVVTKSIPAGVVAAGNPCRVIREITKADRCGYLEYLAERDAR